MQFLALFSTHASLPSLALFNTLINVQHLQCSACPLVQFLALSNSKINIKFQAFDQAVMDGLDSVEVAPAKTEGDSQSSIAAEEQLWRHEFFRDCLAPKKAAFKVDGSHVSTCLFTTLALSHADHSSLRCTQV